MRIKIYVKGPIEIMKEVANEKVLGSFCSAVNICYPNRNPYQSGFALPIYMEHELGGTLNYRLIIAVFAVLFMIFSHVLTLLVNYFAIYKCLIIRSIIFGIGPLVFVFGCNFYTISAYILLTAIGGSIFECRVADYNGFASYP